MNDLIYIVEDEEDIADLISLHLTKAGFTVEIFTTLHSFTERMGQKRPKVILLDLMLPDGDGLEACKELKRNENTKSIPVVMVTARGEEIDRILGLEIGADDYIPKPFSVRELTARIKNLIKRSYPDVESAAQAALMLTDNIQIEVNRHRVLVDGKDIELTATEFNILLYMARHRGWVFTREQILDHLWGDEKAVLDRTVDVHIKHIREKMEPYGDLIKNIRGVGYKLDL